MTVFATIGKLWEQYRDLVIKFAMISLAAVTTTFVYLFQRPVMPDGWIGDWVAGASAVSLVLIYVGLAVAKLDQERRKKVMGVAIAAAVIETIYGTIHVAVEIYNKAHPAETGLLDALPDWAAWGLGLLHAAPFSILLFLVAQFVFHDPTKDANILGKLNEALKAIVEQEKEILGLKDSIDQKSWEIGKLQSDNQLVQQLRIEDNQTFDQNLSAWERDREALNNQVLLLQASLETAENERNELLELVSNSNTSNSNGKGTYTDQIAALLTENPDLSNREIHDMTGIPEGTIKVTAKRVRERMAKASVLN